MFNFPTKRGVAKQVTQLIVISGSIEATTSALDYVVDPQTESAQTAVEVGGFGIGGVAGLYLSGYTNRLIDRVADWRIARKEEENAEVTA